MTALELYNDNTECVTNSIKEQLDKKNRVLVEIKEENGELIIISKDKEE